MASNNNNNPWQQGGSGYNDPRVFEDPNVNPFARHVAPASDSEVMRRQRAEIQAATYGVASDARQIANRLVGALQTIGDVDRTHGAIRAMAKQGPNARQQAQNALAAQRQIISDASDQANDALKELKPALLAAVVSAPTGVKESQIADKKADLIAALQAAGKSSANAKAQAILHQAIANGDAVMQYVLMGPPMQYQAEALGFRQATLQGVYAQAMLDRFGLHPLDQSKVVPGGKLLQMLPDIAKIITGHTQGATAALNQLAAEVGL